jgi:hypothetical protein
MTASWPGARAGDHPLARRDVRPGARRLLGHPTTWRRWTSASTSSRQCRQGRRHQDLAARQGQGDRHAPPPAEGRAHVHRRRLQLRRADRRRRAGLFRRAARHLRRDRAGGGGALAALPRNDLATFHDILAPTVPLSRHIFKAPTRFYKTGVVFMAWLNGHQDHFVMVGGQQSARSTLHLAELFRLADKAGLLRDPELAARAHAARDGLRHRGVMRDLAADRRALAINTAPCASSGRSRRCIEGCARHGIRGISPWRDTCRPSARRGRALIRAQGLTVTGLCRGGMFPAADAAGRRRRSTTTAAPSTRPRASARAAWCWSRAAAAQGLEGYRRRARAGARRARGAPAARARRRHAARHRAAASDVCRRPRLREHARAGATICATSWARGSASPSTSITCGGTRSSRRRSRAPGKRILAFHVCDWLVPTRDLLLDRGMMGDGVIDLRDIRAMVEAPATTALRRGDLLRRELVEARSRRGAVSAKDELDTISAGTHSRFVVDVAKTVERLKAKAAKRDALKK